jgi:transposase
MKEVLSLRGFSRRVVFSNILTTPLKGEPLMLYLGIDQHAKQLTVCIRDERGDVLMRRQVSTQPHRVTAFFQDLQERSREQAGWLVILEVCGFNGWLLKFLERQGCDRVILVQPQSSSRRKTDRRDAAQLSELLWINRDRLRAGERVHGIRQVHIPNAWDAENRQLSTVRQRLGRQRTRMINRIKHVLHKHNLIHEQPTKSFQTRAVRSWLKTLELPPIDRLEMNHLLAEWDLLEPRIGQAEGLLQERADRDANAKLIGSMTGRASYTALAIASRIGPIERFPNARSLTNYWGLTPTCHSSGKSSRTGHISKEGSAIVRFLLGQLVLHMLRRDHGLKEWYQRVKKRRGTKIARVGVMRKLAASIWHMVRHREVYVPVSQRGQGRSVPAETPAN